MEEKEVTFANDRVECDICYNPGSKVKSKMIPVRFVAVCSHGHIQDVPFKEWVHNGPVNGNDHHLSYHSLAGSGDLGSILIECSCGLKKTLAGLMNLGRNGTVIYSSALGKIGLDKENTETFSEDNINDITTNPSGQFCKGHRPWLGLEGINNAEPCGSHLQVLIRGGSNIHYSDIISAIYLPESSENANEYVDKIIKRLGKKKLSEFYNLDGGTMILPSVLSSQTEVLNSSISKEELVKLVVEELEKDTDTSHEISSETDLRREDYQYILKGRNSENSDFKAIRK
jgi:hypothetical protein